MMTDYREPEPFQFEESHYKPFHHLAGRSTETFQAEVLAELRRVVEELDKINVRLSVLDGIKIPGWLRK